MNLLIASWYKKSLLTYLLWPLSVLFRVIIRLRRLAYRKGLYQTHHLEVPVVIIGNITVGGTGKTPLVIAVVKLLRKAGFRPGIVSRGYRGEAKNWPQQVRADSDPKAVGDEAVLLARRCQCPIAVAPDRVQAAQALLKYNDCNIILADDGLQHYALGRDIEIVVIDGVRRLGNEHCLPAGPLREPPARLKEVDIVVTNGGGILRREFLMNFEVGQFHPLRDEKRALLPRQFMGKTVHAIAGIGFPPRFFDQLRKLGIDVIEHPFPDHHDFCYEDIVFDDDLPVVMTEKDAVKCRRFARDQHWYLSVEAKLDPRFEQRLMMLLGRVDNDIKRVS